MTMPQPDLFSYPRFAGWKEETTSRDAAVAIEASGQAATVRAALMELFAADITDTADGMAARLGLNILSVRPRVSELARQGLIERTGERRLSSQRVMAAVWRRA